MSATTQVSGSTIASSVYEQLRRDIVRGIHGPGEKLRIEALQSHYQVSAGPIREALNRLAAEGFAILQDQRGFRVPPVSLEDFVDLSKARRWIHEVALRESISNGQVDWEEKVVIAFHHMTKAAAGAKSSSSGEDLIARHKDFHMSLVSACGSHLIIGIVSTLHDYAQRYLNLSGVKVHGPTGGSAEHRRIMEAALSRNVDLAVRLHNAHSLRTAKVVAAAQSKPTPLQAGRKRRT